jgi:hypothetical protein
LKIILQVQNFFVSLQYNNTTTSETLVKQVKQKKMLKIILQVQKLFVSLQYNNNNNEIKKVAYSNLKSNYMVNKQTNSHLLYNLGDNS